MPGARSRSSRTASDSSTRPERQTASNLTRAEGTADPDTFLSWDCR